MPRNSRGTKKTKINKNTGTEGSPRELNHLTLTLEFTDGSYAPYIFCRMEDGIWVLLSN